MAENYKARMLRQEIAGLERDQAGRIKMVADAGETLENQRVRLQATRRSLRDARDGLARIEAWETVG